MGEVVYVNGQLVASDEANLPVLDRGLLFGDGLYELIRVYGGEAFQLVAHLERLHWGARKIGFSLGVSLDSLRQACLDTLKANEYREALLRLVVTRGILADPLKISATGKPSVFVTCDEFAGYPAHNYENGVGAISVTDTRSDYAMVSTLNCLPNLLAKKEAEDNQAFDALMVTPKGFVTAGATTNIFAILDGILITPPIGDKVPPGITREAVLSIARREGIPYKEDAIINDEINDVEEIFLTGTLAEVMPVVSIDSTPVGAGAPGVQTLRLMRAYKLMTRHAY